ncbi:MAG: ABC transporter ATP-binding protein [Acidimicrobiales bacterium MED-G01]|nr:MAG: ABC transporter ATP-binding protein [Acidimicrobiales bacterium MED-G01]
MVAGSMTDTPEFLLDAGVVLQRGDLHLNAELRVQHGEVVAVMGPNGAGKTTLLHALLGWLPLQSGWIFVDGETFEAPNEDIATPTHRRGLGMVFQDGLLFPHLRVAGNIRFGAAPNKDLTSLIETLELSSLLQKYPSELSAGQTQRVALARTLAAGPKMVLLDEPLASLDTTGRSRARDLIGTALSENLSGALIVTHDPVDAFALAQRVVVLENGRISQFDSPEAIQSQPQSRWVADLMGWNIFRGMRRGTSVLMPNGTEIATTGLQADGEVAAMINPASVALFPERPVGSPRNSWLCQVRGVQLLGDIARVSLSGPLNIYADITTTAAAELALKEGTEVWVTVKATEVLTELDSSRD